MADQSISDHARDRFDRVRRSAVGIVRRSAFYRWRHSVSPGEQLLIVPQDLRTTDPSFLAEVEDGYLGLAGAVAEVGEKSAFDLVPPSPAWESELHGFSWLRHLRASEREDRARSRAREMVRTWIARHRSQKGIAWQMPVVARRLISWLSHAPLILDPADPAGYDRVMRMLNRKLGFLAGGYNESADPAARLLGLTAITYGGLCIADQEHFIDDYTGLLADELRDQILPDGGHVTRDPGATVEIILDLLALRQCFSARNRVPPEAFSETLAKAIPMIRYMRLGDGFLARFNGMSATWPDRVAMVLAYDETQGANRIEAPDTKYVRLQRRQTIVLMDAGSPPPLPMSSRAHAGCLSFEMSVATEPIVVNCGAPGPADTDWAQMARSTAAHSTLTINNTSSSRLVRGATMEERLGAPAINGPNRVEIRREEPNDGSVAVRAFHDGYAQRFARTHERTLRLGPLGDRIDGTDKLLAARGLLGARNLARVNFAIHFHIHPRVAVRLGIEPGTVELALASGDTWRFVASGAQLSLEESVFLAELSGPLQAVQIVLRGISSGATEVNWRLERREPATHDRRRALEERFAVIEGSRRDEE